VTFGDNILVHDWIAYILLSFENTKFLILVVNLLIRTRESIEFILLFGCRLELVTFHQLGAITLEEIWFSFWMLLDLNILLIGFLSRFFGRPWILLMKQQDIIGGTLS
jgi:hypothetical protein